MEKYILLAIIFMPIISVCLRLNGRKLQYNILASCLILFNAILSIALFVIHNFSTTLASTAKLINNQLATGTEIASSTDFDLFLQI